MNRFPLAHLVDSKEFLYCNPAGHTEAGAGGFANPRGWNATEGCCKGTVEQSSVDDVAYLGSIVDWIANNYSVDPRRIYVTGHSNGGFMVHRLLCDRSDLFAAGVSHAGVSWADASNSKPEFPVSILQIHSLRDEVISFSGGFAFGPYPGVLKTLQDWADKLGCTGSLTETGETLELDLAVEGRETTVMRYTDCQGIDIELWRKNDGKHLPTLEQDGEKTDYSEAVIDWLYRHQKQVAEE